MSEKTAARGAAQTEGELERELRATMSSGIGAVLEIGDRVNVVTNSGVQFEGTIDDVNLAGFVVRTVDEKEKRERVFFVSMGGFEYLEILEEDDEGEGEREEGGDEGEGEEATAATTEGAPVTSIASASRAA